MKRISIVALGLVLTLAFSGCGNNTPGGTPSSGAVSGSSPSAAAGSSSSSAIVAAAAAPLTSEAADPAIAEQVTEAEATETVETGAASQALALRIAEMKPEPASQWQEGTHYTRLLPVQPTGAAPGQIEITEVFWYGCSHCYALEPYLESWRKNSKAAYVSFVRLPVMWGTVHQTHARVFYTAEMLGKLAELHTPIFQEIQKNQNPLTSADRIESFFTSHGVSQADFQKTFSSFAVESSLKRAATLGLRYKVESVPLIVINGKYVTDVGRAGGHQQLIALINELASRERGT